MTLTGITAGDTDITVGAANSDTVIIADTDTAEVTIAATTPASEPAANGQFTVSLSQVSDTNTTVSYTVGGDATAGSDYTALSGSVTILAGNTSAFIDVSVLDDLVLEDNETVTVTLTGITAGDTDITVGAANSDTVIIADTDTAEVTIAATTPASEPAANGQFTVSLSQVSDTNTTVSYTVGGDATAGSDYTALSGSVTILAGNTSAFIDVNVLDDVALEPTEQVTVTLTAVTAGDADITIGAANSDSVSVIDDDSASVAINDISINEGIGVATLTVTLTGNVAGGFSVDYASGRA